MTDSVVVIETDAVIVVRETATPGMVNVTATDVSIIATEQPVSLALTAPVVGTVEVHVPGPQGPAGSGGGGGSSVRFNIASPAATWIILHGLGRSPGAQIFLASGESVIADIFCDDIHITVTFANPQTGYVIAT